MFKKRENLQMALTIIFLLAIVMIILLPSRREMVEAKEQYSISRVFQKLEKKFEKIKDYTIFESEGMKYNDKYLFIVRYTGRNGQINQNTGEPYLANVLSGTVTVDPYTGKAVWQDEYTDEVIKKWSLMRKSSKSVKLNKSKLTLCVGEIEKLNVKNTKDQVSWTILDKQIATVDQNGIVTAKAAGTTKVIAKVENKKFQCKVTVKE